MSISLNNHEDRIKTLEKKRLSWHGLTTGSTNIPNSNWVELCRYNPLEYSLGFITCIHARDTEKNITLTMIPLNGHEIDVILWEIDDTDYISEKIQARIANGVVYGRSIGGTESHADNYILAVWGLKLYYNFSYNIYCLIYTFLEFLFKEV